MAVFHGRRYREKSLSSAAYFPSDIMSSGMPELGSKISLISKADIRYEGRLFTVDPQECTIALASGKLTNGFYSVIIYLCNAIYMFYMIFTSYYYIFCMICMSFH